MSLRILNAKDMRLDGQDLTVRLPPGCIPAVQILLEKCRTKHGGYGRVELDVPWRPRTLKASAKLHVLVQALAQITTMSFDEMKGYIKDQAVAMGYGMVEKRVGKSTVRVPISEADASTEEEHMLIETALRLGAEEGHDLEAEYQLRVIKANQGR